MQLDTPTLMVMGSFVAACSGLMLLVVWQTNRKAPTLAIWGFADLLSAGGVFAIALAMTDQGLSPLMAAVPFLFALGDGLIWKGARRLDGKPAPTAVAFAGVALVGLATLTPVLREVAGSLELAISSIYLLAATVSLWRARAERLPARKPLILFMAVHALLICAGTLLSTPSAVVQVPPLMSVFGMIHFEDIIHTVGTAAFAILLVKERSEAASRVAATIDSLTGVNNRAAFMTAATAIMERCRQEGSPVSVLMFDLDQFKSINDAHGHATGDAVLRKFCAVTAVVLRPTEAFGRLGGEEFAAVLPSSDIESACVRAERIRAAFEESGRTIGNIPVHATVSGGVAASANGDHELSFLLKMADGALYAAKAAGRNRIKRADQRRPRDGTSSVIRVA